MRTIAPHKLLLIAIVIFFLCITMIVSCGSGDEDTADHADTDLGSISEPEIMTTEDGVQFVRTPDACFEDLPDFPYEAKYVDIDGLRQGYVDEGPADADPYPPASWSAKLVIPVPQDDPRARGGRPPGDRHGSSRYGKVR